MKLIHSQDRIVNQFQTNTREALEPFENNPLLQGNILNNVILTVGITNVVPTGLNRVLNGWIITRLNASSIIYDTQASNLTPSQNLQLVCSATCTVNLYVF